MTTFGPASYVDQPIRHPVAEKRERQDVNQLAKAIKDKATEEQPQPIRLVYRRQQPSPTSRGRYLLRVVVGPD
jgi:hypothetical protein